VRFGRFTRVMTDTSEEVHDHDRGLAFDLPRLVDRRRALQLLAGAGIVTFAAACGSKSNSDANATTDTTATTSSSTTSSSTSGSTTAIPEETAGPYPGDGSNGPNVLTESDVVRRDIRSSFGSYSGTAEGALLTVTLTVLDLANGARARSGAAVYLWHCDRDGNYSLYSDPQQNYLRGVQVTDDAGTVTFTSIFPACYSGRWPHIHFEVYESLDAATSGTTKLKTSQLALPEDACNVVYASDGYEASLSKLTQVSLATDNVFSDGWSSELATVTGSLADGYTAALNVPV
jgi:protocatechuate 3,4-dioxygenase beta subunit